MYYASYIYFILLSCFVLFLVVVCSFRVCFRRGYLLLMLLKNLAECNVFYKKLKILR